MNVSLIMFVFSGNSKLSYSIMITRHYSDLSSASDWLNQISRAA